MKAWQHRITVVIDGREIGGWEDYSVDSSMLEPADSFQMSRPFDRAAWDLCRTDRPVIVAIDGVTILDGFIDRRRRRAADAKISIEGRDKAGRLVQESAPAFSYQGLSVDELAKRLASPWFTAVTYSNARNRTQRRGRGSKVAVGREPAVRPGAGTVRVEVGQTRWAALQALVADKGLLAWSTADGRELVIGLPNYQQAVQFKFCHPAPGSASLRNIFDLEYEESTADRYSRIAVSGTGAGDAVNFGAAVQRYGEARNNPDETDGSGRDFSAVKELLIADRSVRSQAQAQERADQEMAARDQGGVSVKIEAPLHGQIIAGTTPTLFAPDTMAEVIDEEIGLKLACLITSCRYRSDRRRGEVTDIEFVPKGTVLAL